MAEEIELPIIDHIPEPMNPIPKLIFIVPYRDREQHQQFFANHMRTILEDMKESDYKIYYIEQNDTRGFNRGAMKNIGFLMVKAVYPYDYKDITLVFNDVDTMPFTKNFLDYETTVNNVKHFYGYTFTLGGIVSIKGGDFEKVGGFPNFWAWGYEDNALQRRVLAANMVIDRSQFYPFMDKNIFQMKDGLSRTVNRSEFERYMSDTNEGFSNLRNIEYTINHETGFVNVTQFDTGIPEAPETNAIHLLSNGAYPFKTDAVVLSKGNNRRRANMSMVIL
uniref:Uncharacterized protein n=1 Tax=viral metagenome TaxID=1070528 RepID=A0A6C0I654_9ZZZZ